MSSLYSTLHVLLNVIGNGISLLSIYISQTALKDRSWYFFLLYLVLFLGIMLIFLAQHILPDVIDNRLSLLNIQNI